MILDGLAAQGQAARPSPLRDWKVLQPARHDGLRVPDSPIHPTTGWESGRGRRGRRVAGRAAAGRRRALGTVRRETHGEGSRVGLTPAPSAGVPLLEPAARRRRRGAIALG
jgi:hypothetical protein